MGGIVKGVLHAVGLVPDSPDMTPVADATKASSALAAKTAADQLAFAKEQYGDQKPLVEALGKQALSTAAQDQQIAADQAARSKTAWEQNQGATQGSVGQMGLNALGANHLSPEQTQQLIGLQNVMSNGTPEQKAQAQAQLAVLQKTAETNAISEQNQNADRLQQTGAGQGAALTGAFDKSAAGLESVGSKFASNLTSSTNTLAGDASAIGNKAGATAINNATSVAGAQAGLGDVIAGQRAGLGNTAADGTLADGSQIASIYNGLGDARRADQIGFYDKQAGDLQAVAKQRAADYEGRATTKADADIANAADQAQRQLLRVGGDPNRLAALSGDIANQQQLARITSSNQVAGTNIANLNAADDAARTLRTAGFRAGTDAQYGAQDVAAGAKSGSLQAARQLRTAGASGAIDTKAAAGSAAIGTVAQGLESGRQAVAAGDSNALSMRTAANGQALSTQLAQGNAAEQTRLQGAAEGLGLANAGENAAVATRNQAKEKVDTSMNAGLQGVANYGAGFANTSGQTAQTALAAGSAGTNGLATAVNTGNNLTSTTLGGMQGGFTAAQIQNQGALGLANAQTNQYNAESQAVSRGIGDLGALVGTGGDVKSLFAASSKKIKKNVTPMSDDDALEGLSSVAVKNWTYKPGEGDGGSHTGPMAEDMQEQFGDRVAPGGKGIDIISDLGLQHAAIRALDKRLGKVEQRRSKA